jgi:hypothetical protein
MIDLSKYAEHILNNVQLAGTQQSAYCFQKIELFLLLFIEC